MVDLYNVKTMGDLTWFLGIRIVRDRVLHKTWLVQDAFIDKVCARFGIEAVGRSPDVPLTENWLPQSTEEPDAARTKLYQQLVGSLAYIAVWVGLTSLVRTSSSPAILPIQDSLTSRKSVRPSATCKGAMG
jgi:hypothetical protein